MTPIQQVKKQLEEKIIGEFESISTEAVIKQVVKETTREIEKVAEAILGIDKSWGGIRIKEGLITRSTLISLQNLVATEITPFLTEEVERQLALALTKEVIQKYATDTIRRKIEQALNSHNNNSLTTKIDDYIETSVTKILNSQ